MIEFFPSSGEASFDDDFLEQSIKGATSTSQEKTKRNWLAIYLTIIFIMIIIFIILSAYVWNMLSVFEKCNLILKNVDTIYLNKI